MGNGTLKQSRVGYFARIPHQHKVVITASLVALTVPATAIAFYRNADSSAFVAPGITTAAASPPDAPQVEPVPPTPTNPGEPDVKEDHKTTVTINGQQVSVPANGSFTKTTVDGNSTSHVTVNNTSNQSNTSIHIETHSSSSTSQ